jgi:hypothetical protein
MSMREPAVEECRAFRSYTGKGVQGDIGNRTIMIDRKLVRRHRRSMKVALSV